jgi:hypothetical protein
METGQIVFVDMRRSSLSIAEITKDLAHVVHLLSALTGCNIFSFRGGERHAVLTTGLSKTSNDGNPLKTGAGAVS